MTIQLRRRISALESARMSSSPGGDSGAGGGSTAGAASVIVSRLKRGHRIWKRIEYSYTTPRTTNIAADYTPLRLPLR